MLAKRLRKLSHSQPFAHLPEPETIVCNPTTSAACQAACTDSGDPSASHARSNPQSSSAALCCPSPPGHPNHRGQQPNRRCFRPQCVVSPDRPGPRFNVEFPAVRACINRPQNTNSNAGTSMTSFTHCPFVHQGIRTQAVMTSARPRSRAGLAGKVVNPCRHAYSLHHLGTPRLDSCTARLARHPLLQKQDAASNRYIAARLAE
ncbi:uncharacterized protein BDZ99DRAFT_21752 [Mytilinidion resinicola]|uniref:Uncharacterized protein n=1 Tax=Mytilinidion resinicola TaxID=574789 RepID=A0A6A6ZBR6_9PEZI|nr:uncharacterized protein BDZ99DRAFT_21752 [Mytilinidion resinicola]KAF2817667.1 hypothetical protein BDZ99DRAFT_21752 [Mytilinidion resinicola]